MRRRFDMRVYGYVVMPEHVHLLLSLVPQARILGSAARNAISNHES